ncbi:MAG: M15 family metallopeptidase [Flavobacteriaceae bacterium]|nr:M15 family metallopeptidase [Flavobacteriaceae bacterium]
MNRRLFISTSLGLMTLPTWSQTSKADPFSREFLLGMEELSLYSNTIPLALEAGNAFEKMQLKAKKDGILLEIVSGYRSYDRQKSIWNRKFKSNQEKGLTPENNILKIIEYSTIPGTSRHHWGTDVDIIDGAKPKEGDVLVSNKFHEKGPYAELKKWMEQHAESFGFYLPYTRSIDRKGFYYEPWHYSFAPLSIPILKSYLQLDLNEVLITEGLEGRAYLSSEFMSRYLKHNILGIAAALK